MAGTKVSYNRGGDKSGLRQEGSKKEVGKNMRQTDRGEVCNNTNWVGETNGFAKGERQKREEKTIRVWN